MGAALESASIYWVPLPRSERTQCSRHRSFPITAAGQLRISLGSRRTGFPIKPTPRGRHRWQTQDMVIGAMCQRPWGSNLRRTGSVPGLTYCLMSNFPSSTSKIVLGIDDFTHAVSM
jgi:hypothetical protein